MPKLRLRRFDPTTIPSDRLVLMVAPRGSGKSYAMKNILYYKRDIPIGILACPTVETNPEYKEMVPDAFVYDDFYPEAIDRLMDRQKRKVAEYGARGETPPNAFLIADDCLADKKLWKTKTIRDIFLNVSAFSFLTC